MLGGPTAALPEHTRAASLGQTARRTEFEDMNDVAFVIAPHEYGVGPAEGVEPVVDGLSLVDLFRRADGGISYAGLIAIESALRKWAPSGEEHEIPLLGCTCGDPDCSQVRVRMAANAETVVWTGFWGSSPPGPGRGGRDYPEIGPFRFARHDYESALARPQRAMGPVRERHDF